jgi:hypothetical protein
VKVMSERMLAFSQARAQTTIGQRELRGQRQLLVVTNARSDRSAQVHLRERRGATARARAFSATAAAALAPDAKDPCKHGRRGGAARRL